MHAPHRGRAGFTLIETIGAVVIAAILLAMAVPAIAHELHVREAEVTLTNDLHNAANAYEQSYLSDHAYPDFATLRARGLHLSPHVALDSAAVAGERVYLRLRHVPTGQLCALDYSRSSAVARNRPDCYAGGQDRDTALTITADEPSGTASDTFGIAQAPPPPDTAANPLALLSPTVEGPAARTVAPGASANLIYVVTNHSAAARSFRFELASSSPALVPVPPSPAPLTLLPNIPTTVVVPLAMAADAPADGSSVVPLRAVDVEDERWAGTGSTTLSAGLALVNPAVALNGPPATTHDAGQPFDVSWTVTNRANAARMLALGVEAGVPAHAQLVGTDGAGRVPFAAGQTRTVTAHLQLAAGSDGGTRSPVSLEAVDADAPSYRGSISASVETQTVLAAPSVTGSAPLTEDPGVEFTVSWSIRNESNTARLFDVAASCADAAHLEIVSSTGTGTQSIARGQSLGVSVTYRVAAGAVAGQTSDAVLVATDQAAPAHQGTARVSVATRLIVADPVVVAPAAQQAKPREEFPVTWSVRNASNAPRTLVIGADPQEGDLTVVTAGGGEVVLQPAETRAVTVRYRVLATSLAGTSSAPALTATDRLAPAHTARAAFAFSTALDLQAPTLTPPPDQAADPGSAASVVVHLSNGSNAARTFTLAMASSNAAAAVPGAFTPAVTVPAFGDADVAATVAIPADALGFSQARMTVTATDAGDPATSAAAAFVVTANPVYAAPALAWNDSRTVVPGEAGTDTAVLTNRSNVPVEFCFDARVGDGTAPAGAVVTGAPAAPPCRTLSPAGTADASAPVALAYATAADALAGHTNLVTLTAAARGPVAMTASAELPVAAALVVRPPAWVAIPTSPMFWNSGDQRSLGYTFRNHTNDTRSFCVEIVPADARALKPVDPAPVCGVRVAPGDTARLMQDLLAMRAASGLAVTVRVYDQDAGDMLADTSFINAIRDARPVAVWDAPSPVYMRRWAAFDGSRSSSPVGSPIAAYEWTWGLLMQRWDAVEGRFVVTDAWLTASDTVAQPVVQRAYDLLGTFEVCLRVVDADGRRSDPNCQSVTTRRTTAARLAFRYRGWWSSRDLCIDVWWDSQCDPEHGNARWEVDLRPSAGDAEIAQAYAEFTIALHNTDDPGTPTYAYYTGNSGTTPQWSDYGFTRNTPEAVGKAQDGRWRVLSTAGTEGFGWPSRPAVADHPLVLNVNLASATGIFDGGPHWVPDEMWVTLHVQDADGRWTSATARHDHIKANWQAAWDTVVTSEAPPVATVKTEPLGGGRYRATGTAESPEGRVVDTWWEITSEPIGPGPTKGGTKVVRGSSVDVQPAWCERTSLTFVVKDDRGVLGYGYGGVDGPGGKACLTPGGPV